MGGGAGMVHNKLTGETWRVAGPFQTGDEDPLVVASMLANEDLVVMAKTAGTAAPDTAEHRCVAAVVMFPSGWSLPTMFGRSLAGIHRDVPHYNKHLAGRTNRLFASLEPSFIARAWQLLAPWRGACRRLADWVAGPPACCRWCALCTCAGAGPCAPPCTRG